MASKDPWIQAQTEVMLNYLEDARVPSWRSSAAELDRLKPIIDKAGGAENTDGRV